MANELEILKIFISYCPPNAFLGVVIQCFYTASIFPQFGQVTKLPCFPPAPIYAPPKAIGVPIRIPLPDIYPSILNPYPQLLHLWYCPVSGITVLGISFLLVICSILVFRRSFYNFKYFEDSVAASISVGVP